MKRGIIILLAMLVFVANASAALNASFYENIPSTALCVKAAISDISPSSVEINEEFTVGIQIENCGSISPSEVYFEILSLPTDIEIKEQLKTSISKLEYSNSERILIYHMKTASDAKPGQHVIKARLTYGNERASYTKDYEIPIDVIGEKSELSISSVKTKPILPYVGDTIELTIRIENFGKGAANSLRIGIEHPFTGTKESFMGQLDSDEDGPAIFTFIADKAGEYEIPVRISYDDDFGNKEIKTSINLTVLKKKINYAKIIEIVIVSILVIALILYYIKARKEKAKIIKQLLNGENYAKEIKSFIKKKK